MAFEIEIRPEIPRGVGKTLPRPDQLLKITSQNTQMYSLQYGIDGFKYTYIPSSIHTIMTDLYLELDLLRSGKSHDITICGYPLLQACVEGPSIQFYDTRFELGDPRLKQVGGIFSSRDVEMTVRQATSDVWKAYSGK